MFYVSSSFDYSSRGLQLQKTYSIFQGKILLTLWTDGWTLNHGYTLYKTLRARSYISSCRRKNRPVQRRTSFGYLSFVHLKCNIYLSVTVHAKAAKCQCQIKGFWRTADSFQASEMACKNYRQSIFMKRLEEEKKIPWALATGPPRICLQNIPFYDDGVFE